MTQALGPSQSWPWAWWIDSIWNELRAIIYTMLSPVPPNCLLRKTFLRP